MRSLIGIWKVRINEIMQMVHHSLCHKPVFAFTGNEVEDIMLMAFAILPEIVRLIIK